jgi:hypothetical protein
VFQPISIVADIPTETPGLGFPEYVEALADAIRGGEPPQFTIGLYGAWGSGKSSLLVAIANALSSKDSTVLPVLFDAWRHERAEHIVVPLLHRICEAAHRSGDVALTEHLRRALGALLFSLRFTVAGVGVDAGAAREQWEKSGLTQLDEAFSKPFEELRSLPETLGSKRVAVLVDDLDRCSPENVVSLLEAINLVMDVNGFIFVLALDYDVLVKAVTTRYPHVSGHEFIEKIVQLPFRVPPLMVEAEGFLGQLIPDWDQRAQAFPRGFSGAVAEIADLGLRANPRQIKRMINSFLLLERIVEQRRLDVDQELMAAMIGFQLGWPDQFTDLQDGILAEDQNPFEPFGNDDDEALTQYAVRFFSPPPENQALRQILRLTAALTPDRTVEIPEGPARELRARGLERLHPALIERGWTPGSTGRNWYGSQSPDVRVVLQKATFRFEVRNRNIPTAQWRLVRSWDYRQCEEGLALIDEDLPTDKLLQLVEAREAREREAYNAKY